MVSISSGVMALVWMVSSLMQSRQCSATGSSRRMAWRSGSSMWMFSLSSIGKVSSSVSALYISAVNVQSYASTQMGLINSLPQ